MNLFEMLGSFIPAALVRRALAFVLGFSLMCMYLAAKEVISGRFYLLLQ
jgi:hypothetical protein